MGQLRLLFTTRKIKLLVLLAPIFATLSWGPFAHADNNRSPRSTLSHKSSGTLEFPLANETSQRESVSSRESARHRNIVLAQPVQTGDVPTLAADLNTAMMGPDMVKAMDEQYAARLRDFSLHNGFYATSSFSHRPNATGRGLREETEVRREMAKSIEKYMIVRGIPKFLATKPDTKKFAQTYDQVVVMSKVEGKTQSRWEYKTGVNPFLLRAFAQLQKDGWFFETATRYDKGGRYRLKEIHVVSNKTYIYGHFSTGCNYEVWAKALTPNVGKSFSKRLSARLATRLPLSERYVMPASVTTLAVTYNF